MITELQYTHLTELLNSVINLLEEAKNEKERTKEKEKNVVVQKNLSEEKEQQHDMIFSVALFYLSNGWANAYTEAETAWHYNESIGWCTSKGQHIVSREAWLKRLPPKSTIRIPPAHGAFFADVIRRIHSPDAPMYINAFRGLNETNDRIYLLFATGDATAGFNALCKNNQYVVEIIIAFLKRLFPSVQKFSIIKS